jgi:8-amino-7-oxononanoate synthase
MIKNNEADRYKLQSNIAYFQQVARSLQLPIIASNTAIQPIIIGDELECTNLAQTLLQHGFWVGAIRPPTVPLGTSRLRITLNSQHDQQSIEQLLTLIKSNMTQKSFA